MQPRQPFTMIYAPITRGHLRAIEAKYDAVMHTTIAERLSYEPDVQIRTRKPLKRPIFSAAPWELRFGARNRFRVFYDIDQKEHVVAVLAIGIKGSNRPLIGGEEMRL